MASTDETFDPNDLDSIDALLDEAEQEVVDSMGSETLTEVATDTLDSASVDDQLADLLDIDMPAAPAPAVQANAVKPVEQATPQEKPQPETPLAAEVANAPEAQAQSAMASEPEEHYVPRSSQTRKPTKEISAAEMDSIKKLIVIFGSTLVVLMLAGIGIGIWAAIAGSAGLDEETRTQIEEIKMGTESNTLALSKSSQGMGEVEKKMDALSYQLEQLTADIAALEQKALQNAVPVAAVVEAKAPPAQTQQAGGAVVPPVTAPVVPAAPALQDVAMTDKLNSVHMAMVKAQKRLDEVNKRVKALQEQYGKLLHGVKSVEKQVIGQQVEAKKEAAPEKPQPQVNTYQYSAPDPLMYDQANPDSYP